MGLMKILYSEFLKKHTTNRQIPKSGNSPLSRLSTRPRACRDFMSTLPWMKCMNQRKSLADFSAYSTHSMHVGATDSTIGEAAAPIPFDLMSIIQVLDVPRRVLSQHLILDRACGDKCM